MNKFRNTFKLNNKGFSLIEIIVVVGIMAILAVSSISLTSYLMRGNVKQATNTLYTAIASNQTFSKAKSGDWQLVIDNSTGVYKVKSVCTNTSGTVDEYEEYVLSDRVSTVLIKDSADSGYTPFTSLEFQKNTGAVATINGATVPKAGYADIQIDISGNKAYLRIYYLTGEIEMISASEL